MRITLEPSTTLLDIQQAFQSEFPHLKLQWHQHSDGGITPLRGPGLPQAWTLGTCQACLSTGFLDIDPSMSIAGLQHCMQEATGLHCRILRQHEGLWVEIIQSDTLTLCRQNALGALNSSS